jgi:hypothetical protein
MSPLMGVSRSVKGSIAINMSSPTGVAYWDFSNTHEDLREHQKFVL